MLAALVFLFGEYLDSLTVTNAEMFLLGTSQPALIARAIQRIFHGSAPRLIASLIVLAIGMAVAWIIISSLSRRAIISAVLDDLRSHADDWRGTYPLRISNFALGGLNALRVALAVAAIIGYVAAALAVAGLGGQSGSPAAAFAIFAALVFFVTAAWLLLNWFLSFAAIFVVTQGCGTFRAIVLSGQFCMDRLGRVLAPSAWFGLAHLVLFCLATGAAFFALGFAPFLPPVLTLAMVALVTLIYFAVIDFLYLGRLTAYLYAVEDRDAAPMVPELPPSPPETPPSSVVESRMDPDELILSDVPVSSPS